MTDTEQPKPEQPAGNEAARELSKLGASKGGKARANSLTAEERKEIGRNAIRARWMKAGKLKPDKDLQSDDAGDTPEKAAIGPVSRSIEKPYSMFKGNLDLGPVNLECHVLSDGKRVLTQREMVRVISGGRESGNLQRYLNRNPLTKEGITSGSLIEFDVPGGKEAYGYEATLLVEICDKYIQADEQGLLRGSQKKLAKQAFAILRACAKVGIIALIDEATGYQQFRAKNALQLKLQAFIADEMQEWARMFPEEFWLELARLESVRYSPRSRPLRWGRYVMMFVYDAVDSDVGKALRQRNPDPHFMQNHHQWLKQHGRQKVNDQIQRVIAVMKLCRDMEDFKRKFAHVFKKTPLQLTFADLEWLP
jgi:hypothetical protein